MAKRKHADAGESSDDDAPEAFSFGTSKKAAKGEQEAVRQFQAAQKLKQKEKNRTVDRKLKERAAAAKSAGKGKAKDAGFSHWEKATKGKGAEEDFTEDEDASETEEGAPGRSALEERMARAMRDAEEEDSDLDGEDEEGEGSEFGGFAGEDSGLEEGAADDDDDEEMSDEEGEEDEFDEGEEDDNEVDEDEEMASESEESEEEEARPKPPTQNRNYLPDHLFKSALSAPRNTKITFGDDEPVSSRVRGSPPQKRKRAKRPAKDIVLGSRTIRTLPKSSEAISPAAAKGLPPPRRVDKFLKHSLNVKGDLAKSKTKGWTRRAANLGVMKRSGPAANFVRTS